MESSPTAEKDVKKPIERVEVLRNGYAVVILEGKAERGKPGLPDAQLLNAVHDAQQAITKKYPNAKEMIHTYNSEFIYGNAFELALKDRMVYTQVNLVDTQQLASSLPANTSVIKEETDRAVLQVKWNGPKTRFHHKETLHEAFIGWADTIAQTCSYVTKKYGTTNPPSLSWVMAPGMMSGGVLVAMKR